LQALPARRRDHSAKNGNVTAQIFWLKTRARWKEVPAEHKHSGALALGTYDLTRLSDEDLNRLEAILALLVDCPTLEPADAAPI